MASAKSVHATLSALSARTHHLLLRLSSLLSTSTGIESSLSTTAFALLLLHARLTRLLERRYEKLALSFATQAPATLLPGESVLAELTPPPSYLSQTCAGVKAGADTCLDVWMFMRLWGLVHLYRKAADVYAKPHRDPSVKLLQWAKIGTGATFQSFENAAYLAAKGVLRGEKWEERAPRLMAWANRFWLAQTLLEGLRLLRVRQLNWNEDFGAEEADKSVTVQSEQLKKKWKRDVYATAAWVPLTLHWSYLDPIDSPLSETWQGIFGLISSAMRLQDAWKGSS